MRLLAYTPVPCAASRETVKRSQLAGHAAYGYCASHSRYFWGFRLYLLTTFEYEAKGGKHQVQSVVDPAVRALVTALKRRRGGSDELLAWKQGRIWSDVNATHVNDWIKEVTGGNHSAKDFRTWNATVLAALALAVSGEVAKSKTASKRAMSRATQEVAHFLGNTATVARNSYIDPRVFDRYRSGWTISGVLPDLGEGEFGQPAIHVGVEDAVLDLLERKTDADGVERVGSLAS